MFNLYTTSACHLCETAQELIKSIYPIIDVSYIEIADDDDLIELYGSKIPVLQRLDDGKTLMWPFSIQDIQAFMIK